MPVDSMSIANSEQIATFCQKVFKQNIAILVNFIFLIDCDAASITNRKFRNNPHLRFLQASHLVMSQKRAPVRRLRLDVLLRFSFSVLD